MLSANLIITMASSYRQITLQSHLIQLFFIPDVKCRICPGLMFSKIVSKLNPIVGKGLGSTKTLHTFYTLYFS